MDNFKLVLTHLFVTINYILTTSRRKGITMQIKPLPPKEDQLVEGDVKIRQHLPTRLQHGPLALAKECMELSTKIQVLTEDYLFCTMFMEYINMKDPTLYQQGKLVAEATLKKDAKQ